jgi:hypothetical protein
MKGQQWELDPRIFESKEYLQMLLMKQMDVSFWT